MPPAVSCSSTLSKQFPRFHSNYTYSQRRLPGTRHARFLHLSSRTSSERAQELPTVPIFVTEKVHLGSERNRAIPTKWRTGSSRRCVGGSRHMVDFRPKFNGGAACTQPTCGLGVVARAVHQKKQKIHG